ncbi:MAG: hypothetical protein HY049_19505 [Acidobacteria bacterium]|nr:hypothetical protein [Acidobacteriota bacterium]
MTTHENDGDSDQGAAPAPGRDDVRRERALARGLMLMREARLYRDLGFVRMGDYVVERLGFAARDAEDLMRTEASLKRLPRVARALELGEISAAHVRLLIPVAEPRSEAFWVGLARRRSVRELRGAAHGGAAPPPSADLESLELPAPAWIATLWRDSVTFIRQLVGSPIPQGTCLGLVLAEISAATAGGDDPTHVEAAPGPLDAGAAIAADDPLEPGSPLEQRTPRDAREPRSLDSPASLPPDARAVDRGLLSLLRERQRRDAVIASHLKVVGASRTYRARGFSSLEEYAADTFAISPSRLYCLLKLDRTLRALPAARAAYLSGSLTLKRTLALDGVAAPWNEAAWIRRALLVTLRRLEDEISFWRHLRETRPEIWELLDGGPLPPGIVLVPGRPPRLAARARHTPRDPGAGPGASLAPRGPAVSAAALLRSLEADETLTPLPPRICRIRMLVEPGVHRAWKETVDHCHAVMRFDLRQWETLALLLREFWRVWDNVETRRQRRENPTLERDGWRCSAPACRSLGTGNLHDHHVEFQSTGGAMRDPSNRITLCVGHHLGLLHEGKMICTGRAPDGLRWEMGADPARPPFLVYADEERLICGDGAPHRTLRRRPVALA